MLTKEQVKIFKNKLNKFFIKLRKNGYFARQNFWCCQTCGWYAVPKEKSDKAVFYHQQDNKNIKNGYVYLCWCGDGKTIVNFAKKEGFFVKWDGSENTRICLYFEKPE